MNDIVSIFPTADEFKSKDVREYSLYFFEEELKSIFRLIILSKRNNCNFVVISEISNEAEDFLISKGYKIIKPNRDENIIRWAA